MLDRTVIIAFVCFPRTDGKGWHRILCYEGADPFRTAQHLTTKYGVPCYVEWTGDKPPAK